MQTLIRRAFVPTSISLNSSSFPYNQQVSTAPLCTLPAIRLSAAYHWLAYFNTPFIPAFIYHCPLPPFPLHLTSLWLGCAGRVTTLDFPHSVYFPNTTSDPVPSIALQLHRTHLRLCALNAAAQRHNVFSSSSPSSSTASSPAIPSTPVTFTNKMLHQHGTPYVTPHILHKSYAQSHDNNETSNREFPLLFFLAFLSRVVYYDALVACISHRSYLLGYGAGMIHRAC